MTLKTRIIPCLDVKDGRPTTPAAPRARGRAIKGKTTRIGAVS